jgi:glycosyltransferase involved in cell wall biosynthesis
MTSAGPPLIIFRHGVDYPSKQAHAIQMTYALRGLADAGAEVWMSVGKLTVDSPDQAWESFGLKPHPGVKLLQWPRRPRGLRDWKGALFRAFIKHKLGRFRGRKPVFYLRDKDVNFETIGHLATIREAANARIVLESHTCHGDYLQEQLAKATSEAEKEAARNGKLGRAAALELSALAKVDLFVAVSDSLKARLCAAAGRTGPSAVVRNGAAIPVLPDVPLAERSGVVYVGHAYASKGLDDLMAAVGKLPGVPLKVVGCRDDRERDTVMNWAREHGMADRVTITGFVPPAEVSGHLARSRVAVIPLKAGDGSPIKAFEYMAAGLPIVATDAQANAEIIRESGAGMLVPARSPEPMAAAIRMLLENDQLAETYRQSGLRWIAENSWHKRGERILRLLADIPASIDR